MEPYKVHYTIMSCTVLYYSHMASLRCIKCGANSESQVRLRIIVDSTDQDTHIMYASRHFSTLNLFSQLLLILVAVKSEVHYYITPSHSVPYPQDPCLTLSQFAADSSSYFGYEQTYLSPFCQETIVLIERSICCSYTAL